MLETNNMNYSYTDGKRERIILEDVSVSFNLGRLYSIFGESGSGKTTFLSLIGGLDMPTSGDLLLNGKIMNKTDLSLFRRKSIGFVFQDFNLIPFMSGIENVMTGMSISTGEKNYDKCLDLLKSVGISEEIANRNVKTLSGGEKQRIAIARALTGDKEFILADEPTGNLDNKTSLEIITLLKKLAQEHNKCVIVVTHSKEIGSFADVLLYLDTDKHNFEIIETIP